MAKDSLSKYIKKPTIKSRNIAQKSGSWISNAIRSVGYSTFDVLEELLPATIDVAKVTASTGKDIAESMKRARSSDRTLRNAIDRNYYIGLGREVFKNSLEDLKSGKFYNKDRADKFFSDMNDDMLDLGDFGNDENFDDGEWGDDFTGSVESSDGMAQATFKRKKGGNTDVTSVVVGTDLGPDSAMYQATNYQTETMVNVGRAVVDHSNSNARAALTMLGNMRNEINASLTSISDNVSTISTSFSEVLSKHSALSAKYYEDSINLQTQILESIKSGTGSTQINTRTFKEYNDVMDMFSTGGGIDPKAYAQLVNKQLNNYIDSNMVLSQLKFMAGEKETLKMMVQNPLSFIPKAIMKQLIPNTVKSIITEFDNQMKETGIAALNQISGLQRSQNPILSALGKIFGVQNKITISTIDKGAYNKGAVQWTGLDHRALTEVIPTYLRKIYASVSGTKELAFDYDKGTWSDLQSMEKQFERDKISRETSAYSEYLSDIKDFMDKNLAVGKEKKDEYYKDMLTFFSRLARDSAGGRTFRLGGRNGTEVGRDDIRDLMGKSSSDDDSVKILRAYLQGMEGTDNAKLTALFGSRTQEARANIDRMMREMQQDPTKYNTIYMDTGLGNHSKNGKGHRYKNYTDAHLNFAEHDKEKVTGVTRGNGSGVIDKYGHNQTHYLREILTTLNTGIYVVPIGGNLNGSGESSDRLTSIFNRVGKVSGDLTTDTDRAKANAPKSKRTNYDDTRRAKDVEKGMLDTEGEFTQDQINALSAGYHTDLHTQTDAQSSVISKLLGMLPEDTAAAKMLNNVQRGIDNSKDGITSVFKKLDTALFQVVFGSGDSNGQKGIRALFDRVIGTLKTGFFKFSYFIDDKILKPLNEAMFGEDGLFNKIKQTEFWKKTSGAIKDLTNKAGQFFLGEKLADGTRVGGIFSETANSLKNMGTHVKTAILGEKGPDGKPLPLDQDSSVVGGLKRMFKGVTDNIANAIGIDTSQPRDSIGTRISTGLDAVFSRMSDRAKEFSDDIFGQYNGGSEFFKQFKEDMKGQKGAIGASAVVGAVGTMALSSHMGLLGSMFLPGGPIGGALLGASIGIASKSSGLKDYLFGPEVTDKDGNTFRGGGLITKQVQDFFKENKTGIAIGGFGALASSMGLLPSFFVPGGPIGGALIGGAVSLATKSDAFQELLYGKDGTKDDPTGGIMKKFRSIFGKDKKTKDLAMDAGIGAGVGLVGSFFLPGGPILGALLGAGASVGLATNKFKNWFFGEEGEDGKRKGGIFGKFSDFMKGHIFEPLSTSVKIAQTKIMGFVQENMVIPFKYALKPLVAEAQHIGKVVKDKVTGIFTSIKETFAQHVTRPIGDAIEKHFLTPMKKMLNSFFSGLGRVVGSIISAPFKLISGAGKSAYESQKKRGVAAYDEEQMKGKGFFGRLGYRFKTAFTGGSEDRKQAAFGENGAYYDKTGRYYEEMVEEQANVRANTDAKVTALRNGTTVAKSGYTPPDGTVVGMNLDLFSQRTGLSKAQILGMIRRGEIKANKNGSRNWAIPSSELSKVRNISAGSKRDDAVAAGKSIARHSKGKQSGTGKNNGQTSVNTTSSTSSSKDRKNEGTGNETTVNTANVQSTQSNAIPSVSTSSSAPVNSDSPEKAPLVSPISGTGKQSGTGKNNGQTSVNTTSSTSSSKDRKNEGTGTTSFYTRVQKDVSQIANSVYGQLNGVGSNVNKIYRMMLKTNKMQDEDIQGENNKEYVGFFGRIRTALNRPLQAVTDLITAPFRKVAEVGHKFVDHVKGIGTSIKNAGKALVTGVGGIVKGFTKGIGSILAEVVKLPMDIIHTGLTAVRAALPVVGELAKAAGSVLADGIKVAGSAVVTGVKTIGGAISGAAKGFGQMIGGAMSGLGSLLSSVGVIGADVVKGIWKGATWLGKGALKVGGAIASAPFKIASGLFGSKNGGGLFGKKVQHVIVDGGVLDKVRKVGNGNLGGKGGRPLKPVKPLSVRPLPGGFGEANKNKLQVVVADIQDSVVSKIAKAFGITINENGLPNMTGVDINAGDTAVNTSNTAGGPADDDADKTDNVGDTTVSTNMSNLKSSWQNFKDTLSGTGAAINERINKRQAQIDKGSRTSLLSRFAAVDKDKEESEWRKKILENTGKTAEATKEHKSLFSGIFSKKGLITAAIIALFPLIMKFIKNFKLDSLLGSILNTITTGWGEIGGLKGLINNVGEKVDQVSSVVTGKENHYEVDEDGNLVYDENGNLVSTTDTRSRVGAALTPTKTRINTETGEWENRKEWTQTSGATVNLVGHKAVIPALKTTDKAIVNGAKAVNWLKSGVDLNRMQAAGLSFADDVGFSQKVAGKVTGVASKAWGGVKSTASKVANSGAVTKAKSFMDDVGVTVANSDLIQTFITKASEAISFLVSKLVAVGDKFGIKLGAGKFSKVINFITTKLLNPKALANKAKTIGDFLKNITRKSTVAGATAFIAEIAFITYGAIDGAVNAGALFEVNPDAVDGKMRAIAAVFKGLLNTTAGSVIDFINALASDILGMNFVKDIASWTYNLLSNEEGEAALKAAQDDFTAGYEDYVEQEYEAYVKDAEADGHEAMSFDDFKASNLSTTRSEYNSKTNKSLFKRGYDTVTGAFGGIKKGASGVVNWAKDGISDIGKGIKDFGSGIANKASNLWGGIKSGAASLGKSAAKKVSGVVTEAKEFGSKVWNGVTNFAKGVGSVVKKDVDFVKSGATAVAKKTGRFLFGYNGEVYYTPQGSYYIKNGDGYDYYSSTGSKIGENFDAADIETMIASSQLTPGTKEKDGLLTPAINAIKTVRDGITNTWNNAVDTVKDAASAFATRVSTTVSNVKNAVANSAVGQGFRKFFVGTNETRYYDTNGGYYKKSSGDTYNYFSASDSMIASNIPEEEFNRMLTSGELTAQEVVEQSTVNKIGDGIKSIGVKIKGTWDSAIDSAKTAVNTFKNNVSTFVSNTGKAIANSAIGKGFKKFFIGGTETGYYDTAGGYYIENGETYDYYDAKGIKIAANIPADDVTPLITSGQLTAQNVEVDSTVVAIGKNIKQLGKNIKDGIINSVNKKLEWAREVGTQAMSLASKAFDSIKENGLFGSIAKFFTKKKGKGLFDMKGNYYVEQSNGTYKYFNGNGDEIASNIPAEEVNEKLQDGLLVEGEVEVGDSEAKTAINKMKSSIKDAWSKAKDVVSNAWGSFTSWLGGKGGDDITKSITSETSVATASSGGFGGGKGRNSRPLYGGKGGEDELNGMHYYSQNDPRYKNIQYKQTGGFGDGDTIGDSGCGPTAMAMVASKFTGKDYDPVTMAKMAEAGGYSTSVGTTPGYFSAAGDALGIPNQRMYPSADSLQASLASGNPVILQGASGGYGNGSSPYTSEGHYVTATGLDANNNVIINDPRGRQYSGAYRMLDVVNDTTGMWSFGGGGYGGGHSSKLRKIKERLGLGGKSGETSGDYQKWINICKAVKQAYAAKQLGYSQSRYTDITVGGRTIKGRTDCSGYVQTCLKFFGVMPEGSNISSANVQNPGDSIMKATGFTPYSWPGWENLKEGDVMGTSGHTEIFAYNQNGQHYVYNCGSDSSCNNPNATVSGHSSYQTIWRCGGAGASAISNFAVQGGGATLDSSGGSVESSSSSGGFSSFSELLGGLADAAIKPIYKKFGLNTETNTGTSTSGGVDSTGGSVSGIASADNVSGSDTAQKVWNYFTGLGYSKAAVAGILGNMQQESGVNPASIQGNGKGPAAGIVQWENYNTKSSRWKQMADYAASKGKDWTDLASQLEFIHYELPRLGSFWSYAPNMNNAGTTATNYEAWKASTNVETATRQFEGAFERAGKPAMTNRVAAANKYYELYANSSGGKGGLGGGRPIRKSPIVSLDQTLQKKRGVQGGFGGISQVPMSLQDVTGNEHTRTIIEQNNLIGSMGSNDLVQLFKVAVQYLSQIVTNTGDANTELEALNQKEFGGNFSQTNTTNNMIDNSTKNINRAQNQQSISDRSEYAMAKRVAAGMLD